MLWFGLLYFLNIFKDLLIFSCALEPEIQMKLKGFKNMHETRESTNRKTKHGSSREKLHIVLLSDLYISL